MNKGNKFELSIAGSDITIDRIEKSSDDNISYTLLDATTDKERDEKFLELTRKLWNEFAVHGIAKVDKNGNPSVDKYADMDGKCSLALLKFAGIEDAFKKDKLEYVRPGEKSEGKINIGVGGKHGIGIEEKAAYINSRDKKNTSAAETTYKALIDMGLLEKKDWLKKMVDFTNKVDNAKWPGNKDYFKNSWKTISGLERFIDKENLLKFFQNEADPDPTRELTEDELRKYGFIYKNNSSKKIVNRSKEVESVVEKSHENLKQLDKDGFIVQSTRYGKIVVSIESGKGEEKNIPGDFRAVKAFKCGAFISWNPKEDRFKILTSNPIEEDYGQGIKVRETMLLKFGLDTGKLTVTLGEILDKMTDGKLKPEGKLKDYLENEVISLKVDDPHKNNFDYNNSVEQEATPEEKKKKEAEEKKQQLEVEKKELDDKIKLVEDQLAILQDELEKLGKETEEASKKYSEVKEKNSKHLSRFASIFFKSKFELTQLEKEEEGLKLIWGGKYRDYEDKQVEINNLKKEFNEMKNKADELAEKLVAMNAASALIDSEPMPDKNEENKNKLNAARKEAADAFAEMKAAEKRWQRSQKKSDGVFRDLKHMVVGVEARNDDYDDLWHLNKNFQNREYEYSKKQNEYEKLKKELEGKIVMEKPKSELENNFDAVLADLDKRKKNIDYESGGEDKKLADELRKADKDERLKNRLNAESGAKKLHLEDQKFALDGSIGFLREFKTAVVEKKDKNTAVKAFRKTIANGKDWNEIKNEKFFEAAAMYKWRGNRKFEIIFRALRDIMGYEKAKNAQTKARSKIEPKYDETLEQWTERVADIAIKEMAE